MLLKRCCHKYEVLGEIIIIIKKGAQHRGRIYLSLQICVSSNDVSFESIYYFFLYYRLYIFSNFDI
jgi:hypothetical protein